MSNSAKYVITFDLETGGLCKQPRYNEYYPYNQIKYYAGSRVVQIGYTVHKVTGKKQEFISEAEYIIAPRGFKIDNERFHGITHDMAMRQGIEFKDAIALMQDDFKKASLLVAHNAGFDINVLLSEMWRQGMTTLATEFAAIPYFCTSLKMKHTMKLPLPFRRKKKDYKQPNLGELYMWCFGKPIPDEDGKRHTALFDAQRTAECFLDLLKKNKFVLA